MLFVPNTGISRLSRWTLFVSLVFLSVTGRSVSQSPTPSTCLSTVVAGELTSGNHFEKTIGGGLVFRLNPEQHGSSGELSGWSIALVPLQGHDDFIYPVNPPLRFNGETILGPSYGDDTKASLGHPHVLFFLLSPGDYDKIAPLMTNALWPYSAPRREKAADEYESALRSLTKGQLELTVQAYDADPASGSIRRLKFLAEFIAPAGFRFNPSLKARHVACPKLSD
jgi:hypothetical protein